MRTPRKSDRRVWDSLGWPRCSQYNVSFVHISLLDKRKSLGCCPDIQAWASLTGPLLVSSPDLMHVVRRVWEQDYFMV